MIVASRDTVLGEVNAGCMIENMLLAATSLGLGSLYLWGVVQAVKKDEKLLRN